MSFTVDTRMKRATSCDYQKKAVLTLCCQLLKQFLTFENKTIVLHAPFIPEHFSIAISKTCFFLLEYYDLKLKQKVKPHEIILTC